MLRVTSCDYNFFKLVSYIQKPALAPAELVQAIQAFRSKLSLKWYEQFADQDPESCLASVWMTLFTLARHEDAAVRISVYSAIGGLLFALIPFVPTVIRNSFATAVRSIKETSNASIAIVASFLYICQAISPSDLDKFVTSAPVLHHFGVDVSGFIKYIPRFVEFMAPLDLQFHQLLLRSLLSSFGRNPDHDFVSSVVLLVSLNPEPMTSALMEFVLSNELKQCLLALGPQLLQSKEIFGLLTSAWLEAFAATALAVIASSNATLSDFEQACGTLAMIVDNSEGDAKEAIKKRITETMRDDYPKHYQRLVMLLPLPFEELMIKEEDANSLKCAKIKAVARFVNHADDKAVIKKTLDVFCQCAELHGDVFTALIDSVRECFRELEGVDDKLLAELIQRILAAKGTTWVQDSSILNLMTAIGLDSGTRLIEDFEAIVVGLALDFAIAPHDELANAALKSIYAYVNYSNVEKIIQSLLLVDFFNAKSAMRFLKLLNTLVDALNAAPLLRMAGLVCDILLLYNDDTGIAGQGFKFLRRCKDFKVTQVMWKRIMDCCTDWITRMYRWVTQNESNVSSPLRIEHLPSLITTIETDVVASDIFEALSEMRPLLYCYKFLICASDPSPESAKFTAELVKLFPYDIIPNSRKLIKPSAPEYIAFCKAIVSILKNESSDTTASVCCDFLADAIPAARADALETVRFLIQNPKITSGASLYSFYNFMRETIKKEAEQYRTAIDNRLDQINLALFKIKLGEYSDDEFKVFLNEVPFDEFPLGDVSFVRFMEVSSEVVKISDFDGLDDRHMKFFLSHQRNFDSLGFDEYKATHEHRMSRYEPVEIEEHFNVQLSTENVPKDHCALPKLLRMSDEFDESLALSFCRFSDFVLDTKQFDIILSKVTCKATALAVVDYSKRIGTTIQPDKLLSFLEFRDDVLDGFVAERLSKCKDVVLKPEHERETVKLMMNPDKFLEDYQIGFAAKSKNLIQLSQIMSRASFDPTMATTFVNSLINNISEIESSKRLLALLRVVNQIVGTVGRKLPPQFIMDLNEKLYSLQNSEISAAHGEIALLLARLFSIAKPELLAMCDAFDQTVPKYGLFLVAQATAVGKWAMSSTRIIKSGMIDFFSSEIPSRRLRLLTALDRMLGSEMHFQLFASMFSDFTKLFCENCTRPLFDSMLSQLISVISGNKRFDLIKADFIRRILPVLFQRPNSPQFGELSMAISLVTHVVGPPIQIYCDFIDDIIQTKPYHPRAVHLYCDFVQWLLQNGADDARRDDVILEEIQIIQRLFLDSPTCENAEKLAEALKQQIENFDPSFMLFGKIAMLPVPLLPLSVLVRKYIRKCNEDDIATCKAWIESVSDAYDSKEKAECISLIIEGRTGEVLKHFE